MNVAIVEDETEAAEALVRCLRRYEKESGEAFEIAVFSNAITFLEGYRAVYDLVFMDIKMPYMDGMTAAEKLRETDGAVNLIFVTNLMQYAVQGYRVEAADFIVKPVDYCGLKLALVRVRDRLEKSGNSRSLLISVSGRKTRILTDSILYVEVLRHDLTYHTQMGIFRTYGSLSEAKKQLTLEDGFSCISSCYLVNMRYVREVDGRDVRVGEEILQASFRMQKPFVRDFEEYCKKGGKRP